MLIRYEDFELIINETAGHLTVEARGPRQITVEPLPLGRDLASVLQEDEQLAQALKQLEHGYSPSRAQMLAIGRLLFAVLMPAQIIRAYDRAKGGLSEGTQLRLRLNVRPPTLSRLPWELLFDSTQNTFLAMRRAQPLVRVLDNPNPVAKLRIDGPLSVLLVQAEPIGLAPLNLEESKKALQEAFGRRAEIKVLPHATPAKLRLALQKKTFHILHYDGHGFFDEYEQSGFLALENNKRRSTAVSGQQLANYLSGTQVRLVVLSACQTAQDSMRQRFVGVAQQLMRSSSLPAVVAMQFAIPDTSAVAFTRGFYCALSNGFPVEAALASGRMAIQEVAGMSKSDWATPLLMMRTTDGRLWEHFIEDEEVTPILTSRNPYVGLQTFQEEDAAWFFGREGLVDLLQQKAQESPFLAILGPSGSGKSSVVLAGLLPALKAGALPNSDKWLYVSIKPTNRPLDTLAAALNKLQNGNLGTLSTLRQALASDERTLLLAADMGRADKTNTRLVLVVDQFEELWTLAPTESDARQTFIIEKQTPFIRLLLSAIEEQKETKDPSLLIIFTMRIDFLHRAAEIRDLARYIGEYDVIVSPMQPYELRKAIEEPAKKAGGTFEPGLIDELIEQTRGRQGALPLLEYTLQELWRSKLPDGTMTWHAFKELNGVEGALAIRADSILSEHYNSADKQEQLRHILLRLVQPGEGTADTRRRVLLNELVPAGTDLERVQTLLKPLVDERLLTTTGQQTIGSETIEVSHEALINAWPTFKQWIDHAREDLRLHLQLEEAAKEWESHEENNGYLWSGLRLANAETWLNRAQPSLNERDIRFLEASWAEEQAKTEAAERARREREQLMAERAAQQGRATLFRNFLAVSILLLLVAFAFAVLAWYGRQQAQTAQQTSEALALAGQSLVELNNKPEDALLLSLASTRTDEPPYQPLVSRALYQTFEDALIRSSLTEPGDVVYSATWHPNGERVLSSNQDGMVRIWDVQERTVIRTLAEGADGHEKAVRDAAWNQDGSQVVTGNQDGTAGIWNADTGQLLHILQPEEEGGDTIWSVIWHPNGTLVATGSDDGIVRIWSATTGQQLYTLEGHPDAVYALAWSQDGQLLASGGEDKHVRIWDMVTKTEKSVLEGHQGQLFSVAWHPNEDKLLTSSADNTARVWDVTTGETIHFLMEHTAAIRSAVWSPNGEQILTGSYDRTAQIWDAKTGSLKRTLAGHAERVRSVSWHPNGQQVLTSSEDGTIRIWDTLQGTQLSTFNGHAQEKTVLSVAWSPDGQQVLTGSDDGTVRLWDAQTAQQLLQLPTSAFAVAWNPQPEKFGRLVITAGGRGVTTVWNMEDGANFQLKSGKENDIYTLAWHPTQLQIVTGDENGHIQIWDLKSRRELHHFEHQWEGSDATARAIRSVVWSPDGRFVLTGGQDSIPRMWNADTGELVKTFEKEPGWVLAVAFDPTGKFVAAAGQNQVVYIWDAESGKEVKRLVGHQSSIYAMKWSPDGDYILTGSADETVRLWEMASGTAIHVLEGHNAPVWSVTWHPESQLIVTGAEDGIARLFLLNHSWINADMIRRVCQLFGDEQITPHISEWQGCDVEKANVTDELNKIKNWYDNRLVLPVLAPEATSLPTSELLTSTPVPTLASTITVSPPSQIPVTPSITIEAEPNATVTLPLPPSEPPVTAVPPNPTTESPPTPPELPTNTPPVGPPVLVPAPPPVLPGATETPTKFPIQIQSKPSATPRPSGIIAP